MSPRVCWRRDRPRSGRTCFVVIVLMIVLVSLLVFMLVLVPVFVPVLVMLVVLVIVELGGLLDLHVLERVCRLPQFVCR
jgi:CHASE2 domain-containing sensor protein